MSPKRPSSGSENIKNALFGMGAAFVAANAANPELRAETLSVAGDVAKVALDATVSKANAGAGDYVLSSGNLEAEYGIDISSMVGGDQSKVWGVGGNLEDASSPIAISIDSDSDGMPDKVLLSVDYTSSWNDVTSDFFASGQPLISSYSPTQDKMMSGDFMTGGYYSVGGYGNSGVKTSLETYSGGGANGGIDDTTGDVYGSAEYGGELAPHLFNGGSVKTYQPDLDLAGYEEEGFFYNSEDQTGAFTDRLSGEVIIVDYSGSTPVPYPTGLDGWVADPQAGTIKIQLASDMNWYELRDPTHGSSGGSSGGTDTGTEDTGDSGSGDTGGTDTDTGGTDTGDSGDTGDSADTNDSGDSGDTGDTSETGGVDPDCTEELTGGSRVTESAVTADESTKICVPGSTTAFELSGPATVVTEDSDGDGLMDHATVTLEEGGTADIVVDPSGDYTVDLDYSTRTETEDGAVVEGGTVASLDAGDHLDVGAGVDAFMAVQSNWNACDENGEQSDPMDTPDPSKWLYVDVLEGDVDVNGKNDMRRQSLRAGQFGTYADAFLCENAAEDTGDTGPEDTAVDTGDTSDTAKDTARETAETGTNPPDQTNCGCASTPLEEGNVAFGLALAGLAVGAARRRK